MLKSFAFNLGILLTTEHTPSGVSNDTPRIIFGATPRSIPETDLFLSHMTRFPKKMDHFFGRHDLTNVDVLLVISLQPDTRIDSKIQYGHNN